MRQYYKHHWKTVLNLINNSLICAGSTIVISQWYWVFITLISKPEKKRVFLGFFFQLPETRVSKFCPELETLSPTLYLQKNWWWHTCMNVLALLPKCSSCFSSFEIVKDESIWSFWGKNCLDCSVHGALLQVHHKNLNYCWKIVFKCKSSHCYLPWACSCVCYQRIKCQTYWENKKMPKLLSNAFWRENSVLPKMLMSL